MVLHQMFMVKKGGFILSKKKSKDSSMQLATKILIALAIGVVVGIIVHEFLPAGTFRDTVLVNGIFHLVGQMFLRAIMMLVVPLVFISLVNGAASMGDITKLGRVGAKTMLFYLSTTALAVVIALVIGYFLKPGVGLNLENVEAVEMAARETPPLVQTLYELIPNNIVRSMSEGQMLPIIVFAIAAGVAIALMGEAPQAMRLRELFDDLNELMMNLVNIVMVFAPIGVFGLIAKTFGEIGLQALLPLAKYVFGVYLGLFIHAGLVYGGLLKGFTGLSITHFYKKFFPAMTVAFSTASSNATLPVSLDLAEHELGIAPDIAAFTLPLGATVNMDGTAIMQGVATFFIAQIYGIDLTFGNMLTVVLTATLASIGTAGVPGAGTIMLSMVLQSVGLPIEGIGLLMGIDRLVDMGRTTVNITGDAVCTVIIAKQEGGFDEEMFLAPPNASRKAA